MSNPHRPFGISFLSILLIIGGAVDFVVGLIALFNANDDTFLASTRATSTDVRTMAIVGLVFGVVVVFLGLALRRGSHVARGLISVVALLRVVALGWAIVAYNELHWYQALWPAVIYAAVAGYLLLDKDAKQFFARS